MESYKMIKEILVECFKENAELQLKLDGAEWMSERRRKEIEGLEAENKTLKKAIEATRNYFIQKRRSLNGSDNYGGEFMDMAILLCDEQLEKLNGRTNYANQHVKT